MPRPLGVLVRCALIALPLSLAACESFDKLNPFEEKQTPLPGSRKPLFPEGVPGVDFGAPPPQPSNANIPIPSSFGQREETPQPAPSRSSQAAPPAAPVPTQPQPAAKSAKPKADSDDAWSGTR